MNFSIFVLPILAAAFGYFTNVLAIIMLFRPHHPKRLGGFTLPFTPGLIPKEKAALARNLGNAVGEGILTKEAVAQAVTNDAVMAGIAEKLAETLQNLDLSQQTEFFGMINAKLTENAHHAPNLCRKLLAHPQAGVFIQNVITKIIKDNTKGLLGAFVNADKIYNKLTDNLLEFLESEDGQATLSRTFDNFFEWLGQQNAQNLPLTFDGKSLTPAVKFLVNKAAEYMFENLDMAAIVEEKIMQLDTKEIEKLILSIAGKQLRWIAAIGGILGFIIGFIPALL